jgi:DNA helicase-2/ATP-dependent DNA helicase PcrA
MNKRKWSKYSLAIFDAFTNTSDNLIVQACPGAGKTTNIEHLWSMDDKPTVYLVFNKHNQLEAEAKLPSKANSAVLTLNSLGARCIYNTFGRIKLNERKVIDIIRKRYKTHTNEGREQQYLLSKIVGIVKCIDTGQGISEEDYENIISIYDLDVKEDMYGRMIEVLNASDNDMSQIDFADQLRFPVIYDCIMPEYHNVLGDEVQDFNEVQAVLIERLNAARYSLVGDCHQSIYGFRGAMNNSMSILKERFNAIELPLSITYRCAKDIVKAARQLYTDIEPWDESPQGIVRQSSAEREQYSASDIVLCRINRPLIALAYQLLQKGTPCHVRGRDIGEGLIKLIERQGCFNVSELITRLQDEYAVEVEKARIKEDDGKIQRLEDKYSSALLFCGKAKLNDTPDDVISIIHAVFDQGKGVCLSTVHKAKGLEAERAMLLDAAMYSTFQRRARQQWQREQERNVQYVAITRAKRELIYM